MKTNYSTMRPASRTEAAVAVSEQDLNAYFDGELPLVKRQALDRLLLTDAALRSQAAQVAQLRTLVQIAYGTMMTD